MESRIFSHMRQARMSVHLLYIIKLVSQIIQNFMSFYHEIFILEQNSRNHESVLPRKFGAIR